MARPRKTERIDWLKATINYRIRVEKEIEARRALSYLLSDILMQADAYRGFKYIDGWTGTEDYRREYY